MIDAPDIKKSSNIDLSADRKMKRLVKIFLRTVGAVQDNILSFFAPKLSSEHIPIARVNEWYDVEAFIAYWMFQHKQIRPRIVNSPPKIAVLFPADPDSLIGSRGDEAMLLVCANQYRALNPNIKIVILVRSSVAWQEAKQLGFCPASVWHHGHAIKEFHNLFESYLIDSISIFGADVMDGYYHPVVSAERLALADLAVRKGIPATILGFSFNAQPVPYLAQVADRTHEDVIYNVHDPISLKRWHAFTTKQARLVADCAFLLQPTREQDLDDRVTTWIRQERALGRTVLGFNVHTALCRQASIALTDFVDGIAQALQRQTIDHRVSWLMLSHDFRLGGDLTCLSMVHQRLKSTHHFLLPKNEFSAPDIKGIAGLLDGIVTGRMHLAIAALGMGVPVAAFGYQDKFEGLLDHFKIQHNQLDAVDTLICNRKLDAFLNQFVENLPMLRTQIQQNLGTVLELAARNFNHGHAE